MRRQQHRVLQDIQNRAEHDVLEVHVWLSANIPDWVLDTGSFDRGRSLLVWYAV